MPGLAAGEVHVWWGRPGDVRPRHALLLNDVERVRVERLLRQEDRDRFVAGTALLRLALAAHLGCEPRDAPLDRTCATCGQQHGRPRAADGQVELSLSHSGQRAVVAVGRGSSLGVDVESLAGPADPSRLADRVLSEGELAVYRGLAESRRRRAFVTYWTRKEAVLKATGEGLRASPAAITVSAPAAAPRLLAWGGRPEAPGRTHLYRLHAGPGHVATLAVLGIRPSGVRELCVRLDVS